MDEIRKRMLKNENNLSEYACRDSEAVRFYPNESDIRPEFYRDIDRVIWSRSYFRYMDKTQVFIIKDNDHISRRMSHVQMVSKIARTIGRALNLNEDLIEAMGLGHDLGHVPFGHLGEKFLNELSLANGQGVFMHNVQSVRNLMVLENNGKGLNLTVQVLDGILCHNGELILDKYAPVSKTKEDFLREYADCYKSVKNIISLKPMTLEGCVVRISDVISYIGKDIEDALLLGVLDESELPESLMNFLGKKNGDIINTFVMDIIENSMDKPYIMMSSEVNRAMVELQKFNYENIYYRAVSEEQTKMYHDMMNTVFYKNLEFLNNKNYDADIYKVYLDSMSDEYKNNTCNERVVIDYIAGMTDDYFMEEHKKLVKSK